MSIRIYHNPRCSKSRAALQLLKDRALEAEIVEYLKQAPSGAELRELLRLLGIAPRDIMRKGEAAYRELGLDDPALAEEDLIAAMAAHPILIERPIVIANGKAALGRPPEKILEIL